MGSRFCPVPSSHPSMGLSQDSDRNNAGQGQRRPYSEEPASRLLPGRTQEHTQEPVAHSESHPPCPVSIREPDGAPQVLQGNSTPV